MTGMRLPPHPSRSRAPRLMFIENAGQFAGAARFQVRGGSATLWLAEDALWITMVDTPSQPSRAAEREPQLPPDVRATEGGAGQVRRGANVRVTFPGANSHPVLEPFRRLDAHVSYLIGNDPSAWRPDVPVWGGVRYKDLYTAIDLELTSEGGRLVPYLVAHPNADLAVVRLQVEGAEALALARDSVHLATAAGNLSLPLFTTVAADGSALHSLDLRPLVKGNEISLRSPGSAMRPVRSRRGFCLSTTPAISSTAPFWVQGRRTRSWTSLSMTMGPPMSGHTESPGFRPHRGPSTQASTARLAARTPLWPS